MLSGEEEQSWQQRPYPTKMHSNGDLCTVPTSLRGPQTRSRAQPHSTAICCLHPRPLRTSSHLQHVPLTSPLLLITGKAVPLHNRKAIVSACIVLPTTALLSYGHYRSTTTMLSAAHLTGSRGTCMRQSRKSPTIYIYHQSYPQNAGPMCSCLSLPSSTDVS